MPPSPAARRGNHARVALTSAAAALVLALAGVLAGSATSQAAEPAGHTAKTLTGDRADRRHREPPQRRWEGTLVEFGNGKGRMTLQVLSLIARDKGA